MDLRTLFCASLLLAATGCGESEVNADAALSSGYNSLTAKNYDEALAHFDSALASLTPDHEDYLDAKLSQLKALAYVDAEKTKTTLLAVPKDLGVGPQDYRIIVGELTESAEALTKAGDKDGAGRSMDVAVQILQSGSETFPEFEDWDQLINATGDKAKNLGADNALKALEGLGYTGDGD